MTAAGCSLQVGWKHQEAVKELEEARKVRSSEYYAAKRKLRALREQAVKKVEEKAGSST